MIERRIIVSRASKVWGVYVLLPLVVLLALGGLMLKDTTAGPYNVKDEPFRPFLPTRILEAYLQDKFLNLATIVNCRCSIRGSYHSMQTKFCHQK
jgi:hypothetical protein